MHRALFMAQDRVRQLQQLFSDGARREMALHRALFVSEERRVEQRMLRERERLVYDEFMRGTSP
jgi:hypothetical protein